MAMVGKGCVAIASDLRLGNQALGISSNFQKVRMPSCSSYEFVSRQRPVDLPDNRSYIPRSPGLSHGCNNTVNPHPVLSTPNAELTNTSGKSSSDTVSICTLSKRNGRSNLKHLLTSYLPPSTRDGSVHTLSSQLWPGSRRNPRGNTSLSSPHRI